MSNEEVVVPLPAGLNLVTITGGVRRSDGTAAIGQIEFALPAPLLDGNDELILGTAPIIGPLGNGQVNMQVPANDTPGVSPAGWAYTVTIRTDGLFVTFNAVVPSTPNAITIDQLVQVASPPVPAVYVPLQALGNTVATLVGGKVPASQLPTGAGGTAVASVAAGDSTITIGGTATDPTVRVATSVTASITSAANAAAAAQSTANAAYVKPGGGIPKTDLATAVQTILNSALTVAPPPEDAVRYGCHSRNVPLYSVTKKSTINNEAWFARILVRAGTPIASMSVFRTAAAAVLGAGGLNSMALYADAGGAPIASSATDDTMWVATGQITKALAGVPTPSVDTWYLAAVTARGYSTPAEFGFADTVDAGVDSDIGGLSRYKAGTLTSWPATLNPATDLASGGGFVLPIYLG
jgi:hypothetical protein